jgi:predicted transcriptional regulator
VGEFDIKRILRGTPDDVWKETCHGSGISKEFFDSYFHMREEAFAIEIGEYRKFIKEIDPRTIYERFFPPQSFMYVENELAVEKQQQLNLFATA